MTNCSDREDRQNKFNGHYVLLILSTFFFLIVQLSACMALMCTQVWDNYPYLAITAMGISAATLCLAAIFLAWAAFAAWLRIVIVVGLLLLTFAACALGNVINGVLDNSRFGFFLDVYWQAAKDFYVFLPLTLVSISLPAWFMRIARGWTVVSTVGELDSQPVRESGQSYYRYGELAAFVVVLLLASMVLFKSRDFKPDQLAMAFGFNIPIAVVFGFAIVLPIVRLILGAKRYWLWSLGVLLVGGLVGFGFGVYVFLIRLQAFGGSRAPAVLLVSEELYMAMTLFLSYCLMMLGILLIVRALGFQLKMPKYQAAVARPSRTRSLVHPLDQAD